jgi:hypothetical protein
MPAAASGGDGARAAALALRSAPDADPEGPSTPRGSLRPQARTPSWTSGVSGPFHLPRLRSMERRARTPTLADDLGGPGAGGRPPAQASSPQAATSGQAAHTLARALGVASAGPHRRLFPSSAPASQEAVQAGHASFTAAVAVVGGGFALAAGASLPTALVTQGASLAGPSSPPVHQHVTAACSAPRRHPAGGAGGARGSLDWIKRGKAPLPVAVAAPGAGGSTPAPAPGKLTFLDRLAQKTLRLFKLD